MADQIDKSLRVPDPFFLRRVDNQLTLFHKEHLEANGVSVDFCSGAYRHRRKFGGGKAQAVARAAGFRNRATAPSVLDATAGLGRDAFVLASLGCRVHMLERSPIIAALLEDGIERASQDPTIGEWVTKLMSSKRTDSLQGFVDLPFKPDVVYLDPMYPERKRTANAKKEIEWIKELVGEDPDADELLPLALGVASKRVVVKRPLHVEYLNQYKSDADVKTKAHRFDIYILNK